MKGMKHIGRGPRFLRNPLHKGLTTTHLLREGYGKQPALCGFKHPLVSGGPATCDCRRCLTTKAGREWIRESLNPTGRRLTRENLKRLGLPWPT
jgi:hypothetical protein